MQATAQLIRDEAALFLGRRPTEQINDGRVTAVVKESKKKTA
jgi:hypothetical protein